MGNGSRKQITFDLCQESLKQHYPHQEPVLNSQYYKRAYDDIKRFMARHGFEHRQYSVYTSREKLTTLDVVQLMESLAKQMPWLYRCVNEIDVTNIGVQHSLLQSLEDATKGLDLDLDLDRTEGMIELPVKAVEADAPNTMDLPRTGKKPHKRRKTTER